MERVKGKVSEITLPRVIKEGQQKNGKPYNLYLVGVTIGNKEYTTTGFSSKDLDKLIEGITAGDTVELEIDNENRYSPITKITKLASAPVQKMLADEGDEPEVKLPEPIGVEDIKRAICNNAHILSQAIEAMKSILGEPKTDAEKETLEKYAVTLALEAKRDLIKGR